MQNYTEMIVKHVTPNKEFSLEAFNQGFRKLDPENKGYCEFDQVRGVICTHFQSIGLYKEKVKFL